MELTRGGKLSERIPYNLSKILRDPKGKYALPRGWSYERCRDSIRIECGQADGCDSAVFVQPIDIFIEMDAEDVTRWHDECRNELRKAR